jgi:N-acetylglutamate synthase-like GNAT family acetyltransferase
VLKRCLSKYVAPEARFTGVSKKLLASLEVHARGLGIAKLTLQSSLTALPFYESREEPSTPQDLARRSRSIDAICPAIAIDPDLDIEQALDARR